MTAALIVTAGKTSTGRAFAPSKEVGTIPAIQRIVRVFQRAGIRRIVVVCGDEQVKKDAGHLGLVFLPGRPEGEMLDNVKLGLAYLQDKCGEALVTHANVPLFSAATVRTLLAAEGDVRIPVCAGASGHPLVLRAERFREILAYGGRGGLAGAVKGLPGRRVEVDDQGVLANIAAGEDYRSLVADHDLAGSLASGSSTAPGLTSSWSSPARPVRCWRPAARWASPTARDGRSSPSSSSRPAIRSLPAGREVLLAEAPY